MSTKELNVKYMAFYKNDNHSDSITYNLAHSSRLNI
jgi:hypothetical protein